MLAEIQGTSDKTETKAVTADVELENSTTTEEPQVTQETPDPTTEESQVTQVTPNTTTEESQVTQETPDTTTEESQVTQETPDTTTEESQAPHETPEITPGGAGLAYASAVTLTALCVAAMVL